MLLLKKEVIYMETKIQVKIARENEIKLVLNFESKSIELNLSSESIEETQKFFIELLEEIIEGKYGSISFNLQDDDKDLYHDVAEKYLNTLESELKQIITEIPKK